MPLTVYQMRNLDHLLAVASESQEDVGGKATGDYTLSSEGNDPRRYRFPGER